MSIEGLAKARPAFHPAVRTGLPPACILIGGVLGELVPHLRRHAIEEFLHGLLVFVLVVLRQALACFLALNRSCTAFLFRLTQLGAVCLQLLVSLSISSLSSSVRSAWVQLLLQFREVLWNSLVRPPPAGTGSQQFWPGCPPASEPARCPGPMPYRSQSRKPSRPCSHTHNEVSHLHHGNIRSLDRHGAERTGRRIANERPWS